jgi:glycyl-tRNA synthetase beta chain
MAQLFIELLAEEIPAFMQKKGAEEFLKSLISQLETLGLPWQESTLFYGPRRLAVRLEGLQAQVPDRTHERKGPRVGEEGPLKGFLTSTGLKLEDLKVKETPKGSFYFAYHKEKGGGLENYLPPIIDQAIKSISWPTSMTWGHGTIPWVRPLKSLICFLDQKLIAIESSFGDTPQAPRIVSKAETLGHRFLHKDPVPLSSGHNYEEALKKAYVMVDQQERRQRIWQTIEDLAQDKGLQIVKDDPLLEEIIGLVEWPCVMMGSIAQEYMSLPEEVLMTSMRVHQRYFALRDAQGSLAPNFIFVANIPGLDQGKTLISGNERVLRARLSDALFFYTQDQSKPLNELVPGLRKITFHGQLGTLAEKVDRLQKLASFLAEKLGLSSKDAAEAALLCKLDLMTGMVGEFPELQGVMGTYYARHQGHNSSVSQAIYEHYLPKLATDSCPQTPLGSLMALSDRLDTLVGFFGIKIRPTGSKDPYALRRAALGTIRILEETQWVLSLPELIAFVYSLYGPKMAASLEETQETLKSFFEDRLKVYWRDQGLSLNSIQGILRNALTLPLKELKDIAQALDSLFQTPQGQSLISLYKRATHILKEAPALATVNPSLFQDPAEAPLYKALEGQKKAVLGALKEKDYDQCFHDLALLQQPMDDFFTTVLIMHEEPTIRHNRMALVQGVKALFDQVADFSDL